MNLLLLSESDLISSDTAEVCGEQALHILKIKKLEVGDRIALGVLNGAIGEGIITEIENQRIRLAVKLNGVPKKNSPEVKLLVALPRPQILKNILFNSAMFGVSELVLVGAERTEKSYFSSKMLREDNIERYIRYGLEQSVCTIAPRVEVYSSLSRLDFEKSLNEKRFLLDPRGGSLFAKALCSDRLKADSSITLAIGPEGGWQDAEIEALKESEFITATLGERVLRVDSAVTALLGMIVFARQQVT